MSDINTLGRMLRNYTADAELPLQLAPQLAADMLKKSDLHAAFGDAAGNYPWPSFLEPEQYQSLTGEAAKLAEEAAAELKQHGTCLIHDGLSADCILLKEEGTEICYPEEQFRGPFGYDLAELMVSGLLAWCRGYALLEDDFEREDFCDCCLDLISNLVDQLVWNYDGLFDSMADAPKTEAEEFKKIYFEGMMQDLAVSAGLEVLRVLLGSRSAEGLEEISDSDRKAKTERILLRFAETCIWEKDSFYFGADFAAVIERAAREEESQY